jgi:sugar/nucleoside kinase (ribokinase family)
MMDVTGLGSALMDLTAEVDDRILEELRLKKGSMHLVDEAESRNILERLSSHSLAKTPGGSAANAVAGIAAMGGKALLMGKIGKDALGDFYRRESEKSGLVTRLRAHDSLTGFAITLVTPDSERTFATHLGAAMHFEKGDVSEDDIKQSAILHVEGYMLEPPGLKEASLAAMEIAKRNGVKVSIDLADPSLVQRNLDSFKGIMREYADIIHANEDEAAAFTGLGEEEALEELSTYCSMSAVKLGARGSILKAGGRVYRIQPNPVAVVNTNGAGDMYAAGLLFGIARGYAPDRAGRVASYAASLVVAQLGARLSGRLDVSKIGI